GMPGQLGRYGADGTPGTAGRSASFGPSPHAYAQVDFDATDERARGAPTQAFALPGMGGPPWNCFPSFPPGYGNGSSGRPGTEGWEHPLLSNPFRGTGHDRAFAAWNMEALLRDGDTGADALSSELLRLCPASLRAPRARRLVTTHSW